MAGSISWHGVRAFLHILYKHLHSCNPGQYLYINNNLLDLFLLVTHLSLLAIYVLLSLPLI